MSSSASIEHSMRANARDRVLKCLASDFCQQRNRLDMHTFDVLLFVVSVCELRTANGVWMPTKYVVVVDAMNWLECVQFRCVRLPNGNRSAHQINLKSLKGISHLNILIYVYDVDGTERGGAVHTLAGFKALSFASIGRSGHWTRLDWTLSAACTYL